MAPSADVNGNVVTFVFVHPTQVSFTCPAPRCNLSYITHAGLIRHMGVTHGELTLTISFQRALCPYSHMGQRMISLHFRHTHGAALSPIAVDGSKEKVCHILPPSRFLLNSLARTTSGRSTWPRLVRYMLRRRLNAIAVC